MDFKIHSKFQPTGDQPQAIDKIVENIENGITDQILLGVKDKQAGIDNGS